MKLTHDQKRTYATDRSTPVEMLNRLARDKDDNVRQKVAKNPSCPVETMLKLADDENCSVRWSITQNPAVSGELLQTLTKDPEASVKGAAKEILTERKHKKKLNLGRRIGKGWSSVAYEVRGKPNIVVKLTHKADCVPLSDIQSMIGNTPECFAQILKVEQIGNYIATTMERLYPLPDNEKAILEEELTESRMTSKIWLKHTSSDPAENGGRRWPKSTRIVFAKLRRLLLEAKREGYDYKDLKCDNIMMTLEGKMKLLEPENNALRIAVLRVLLKGLS